MGVSGTVAPDGGFWGWMAVFACFMGNVIGDGVMYRYAIREDFYDCEHCEYLVVFSFGVFLPKFKEYFGCGSGEVSTINSIQMGVTFASGTSLTFCPK